MATPLAKLEKGKIKKIKKNAHNTTPVDKLNIADSTNKYSWMRKQTFSKLETSIELYESTNQQYNRKHCE